jgi:hypothetical protein
LSPLPWNLVDRHLAAIIEQGFNTYGYADDIVIIVQGKFAHTVRKLRQAALNVVDHWTANISPHKTAVFPFTNRRKLEGLGPPILRGKQLQMLDEVLGIWGVSLDSKRS